MIQIGILINQLHRRQGLDGGMHFWRQTDGLAESAPQKCLILTGCILAMSRLANNSISANLVVLEVAEIVNGRPSFTGDDANGLGFPRTIARHDLNNRKGGSCIRRDRMDGPIESNCSCFEKWQLRLRQRRGDAQQPNLSSDWIPLWYRMSVHKLNISKLERFETMSLLSRGRMSLKTPQHTRPA